MSDAEVRDAPTEDRYGRPQRTSATRLRSPIVEAHRWRLVAVLALVGFLGTTASTVYFGVRRTVEVMVITVDQDHHVRAIGQADIPEDRHTLAIKRDLVQVVEWIRTIPADADLLKLNWQRAMRFMAPEGAELLRQQGREMRPDELQKSWRVRVQVNDVQPVTRESYFVEWEERFYRVPDMSLRQTKRYRSVMTFALDPPTHDTDEARLNWLGLKIRDVNWYRQPDVTNAPAIAPTRRVQTGGLPE